MYSSSSGTNFAELLAIAKQNADAAKKKTAHLNNDNKRRADPKQVKLKDGVAKFLAKREEEEKKKKEQEKLKKEKLLQLRQQDRKATNRVRKMLSMTKSANKSCVEDANDCLNASVAAQAQGDFQPDEDDYGYTSNYADMMHKKMMEKYKALPIKPAFPQTSVPVPKHQSLSKTNGTGWRGKNGNNDDDTGYSSPEQERYEEPSSRKPEKSKPSKKAPPPPPDYRLLLELAQQKQQVGAPVSLKANKPINRKEDPEDFEFGRPMTAKEKKAFMEKKALEERVKRKFEGGSDGNNNSNGSSIPGKMPSFKIPKARGNDDGTPSTSASSHIPAKKAKMAEPRLTEPERKSSMKESSKSSSRPSIESNGHSSRPGHKPMGASGKPSQSNGGMMPRPEKSQKSSVPSMPPPSHQTGRPKQERGKMQAPPQPKVDPRQEKLIQQRKELIKEKPRYLMAFEGKEPPKRPLMNEPSKRSQEDSRERAKPKMIDDRQRPRMKSREEMGPPHGRMGEPSRRDMPMKGQSSRMRGHSPPRMRGPPQSSKNFKGRAVIDSDEEYDSEMDDFIDDSEMDMGDISAEIGKLFNYDKRRFMDEDSDDDIMESSVAEQILEEQRSLRIGIREDREEELRELAEKKRMAMKKKRR